MAGRRQGRQGDSSLPSPLTQLQNAGHHKYPELQEPVIKHQQKHACSRVEQGGAAGHGVRGARR